MARILVLGRNGQVARALARLDGVRAQITCAGRESLDISDFKNIGNSLRDIAPDAVINAAAFAAVDQAESEPSLAFRLNRDAPGAVARACADLDLPFVHISTDYVFDGEKGRPYIETDLKAPLNVYGASKAEGEDQVLSVSQRTAVFRTSAVFDHGGGRNFITTMLHLGATRDAVRIVTGDLTRPTPAAALADACITGALALLDRAPRAEGLFHFAGAEDATWVQYAQAIFAASAAAGGPTTEIISVNRAEFPQPARRPRDTRLDSRKVADALGVPVCSWLDALSDCVAHEVSRMA